MSYADLKPMKFDESFDYYSPVCDNGAPSSITNYSYIQSSDQYGNQTISEYFSPVVAQQPTYEYEIMQEQINPQSVPPSATYSSVAPPQRPVSISRESCDSELSDEVRFHWMPMTWIERSSDDCGVFNFVCLWDQCVDVKSSKQELADHLLGHLDLLSAGRAVDETCTCLVRGCMKELRGLEELRRHMTMHIFQADCQQKGSEALIEKEEFSLLENCGFEPSTNVHYEGEVLVCQWEDCGIPFSSLQELFDHSSCHIDYLMDIHRVEQVFENGDRKVGYPCKWSGCFQITDSKANLRRHIRMHSGEKVLACPFCARFFSRRDKLYDHCIRRTIIMNDTNEPYICKLCQKSFGTEKALCMHVTRHLVSHTCPLCGLAVSSRSDLHRHLMIRHSSRTKDFKCDRCSRCFFSESELNKHYAAHTDPMYNCKHCDLQFRWKKQLLKHMREHDENYNPSPYVCHLCERCYTTGFALGRHLTKQHKLPVPYGFSRFTYKKCADGLMRLQTKKIFRNED